MLGRFELIFSCSGNTVRFFVLSDKDLSALSNNIDGFLIRRSSETAVALPATFAKERFVQFVSGGNLLDLKEKYAVSKSKDLEFAVMNIRAVGSQFFGQMSLYFKKADGQYGRADKMLTAFPAGLLAVSFEGMSCALSTTRRRYYRLYPW